MNSFIIIVDVKKMLFQKNCIVFDNLSSENVLKWLKSWCLITNFGVLESLSTVSDVF